ncbi:hypothetical protein Tco_1228761 [Tanacetum coccineum]
MKVTTPPTLSFQPEQKDTISLWLLLLLRATRFTGKCQSFVSGFLREADSSILLATLEWKKILVALMLDVYFYPDGSCLFEIEPSFL